MGQRPWILCDMGLSLPRPTCEMSKSPPLKIWGHVVRVSLSMGGLGERDGCEQSTEESKLAINSWRNRKEGVQIILIRGLAALGNSYTELCPYFFLLCFRTCIQMWQVTGWIPRTSSPGTSIEKLIVWLRGLMTSLSLNEYAAESVLS